MQHECCGLARGPCLEAADVLATDDAACDATLSAGKLVLCFPRGWPAVFATQPLKSFMGKALRGVRCRAVAVDMQSGVATASAVPQLRPFESFSNAQAVANANAGWDLMRGFAVWEVSSHEEACAGEVKALPIGTSFVALRHWWNVKPDGTWADLTPPLVPPAVDVDCRVLLVESPLGTKDAAASAAIPEVESKVFVKGLAARLGIAFGASPTARPTPAAEAERVDAERVDAERVDAERVDAASGQRGAGRGVRSEQQRRNGLMANEEKRGAQSAVQPAAQERGQTAAAARAQGTVQIGEVVARPMKRAKARAWARAAKDTMATRGAGELLGEAMMEEVMQEVMQEVRAGVAAWAGDALDNKLESEIAFEIARRLAEAKRGEVAAQRAAQEDMAQEFARLGLRTMTCADLCEFGRGSEAEEDRLAAHREAVTQASVRLERSCYSDRCAWVLFGSHSRPIQGSLHPTKLRTPPIPAQALPTPIPPLSHSSPSTAYPYPAPIPFQVCTDCG